MLQAAGWQDSLVSSLYNQVDSKGSLESYGQEEAG